MLENNRLFNAADPKTARKIAAAKQEFEMLKQLFIRREPDYPVDCRKVGAADAASAAGLSKAYESGYRLYCQFTHGALLAKSGDLDEFSDPRDTPYLIWCILNILEELRQHTPAEVGELSAFSKRLYALADPEFDESE
jgi:hypothetical protein